MDNDNNVLGDVMGALVNNGLNGNNNWGNRGFGGIYILFFLFMAMFFGGGNGNGFFNRGNNYNIDPDIASKSDVAQTAAWQATQGDLRSISADIDRIDRDITNLGYQQLNSNAQTVQTITNAQMANMAQNNQNLLAILGQGNQTSRDILASSANTNQNISQQGYNTSMAIVGTGNNLNNTIRETSCQTQREIINANGDTKLGLATLGAVIQKTAGDNALQNCQQTNAIQNTANQNANMLNNTIRDIGNQNQQGINTLGFIIQNKADDIKTELLKTTCAITQNDNQNTQKILDKMCQMELSAANQRNNELVVQNQALTLANQVKDLQAGQLATAYFTANQVIQQVNPRPVPAIVVGNNTTGGTTTTAA